MMKIALSSAQTQDSTVCNGFLSHVKQYGTRVWPKTTTECRTDDTVYNGERLMNVGNENFMSESNVRKLNII